MYTYINKMMKRVGFQQIRIFSGYISPHIMNYGIKTTIFNFIFY